MLGICDRCQQRITNDTTVVQLQDGELVRLSDGMPRPKANGTAQFHTICHPCGQHFARILQQVMDPTQFDAQRSA